MDAKRDNSVKDPENQDDLHTVCRTCEELTKLVRKIVVKHD